MTSIATINTHVALEERCQVPSRALVKIFLFMLVQFIATS